MRMARNAWQPLICTKPKCYIEYEWDDDDPNGFAARRVTNIFNRCPDHVLLPVSQLYATVFDENSRYDQAMARLREVDSSLFLPDNTPNPDKLRWGFAAGRVLEIHLPQTSDAERAAHNTDLQARFGAAKVRVR